MGANYMQRIPGLLFFLFLIPFVAGSQIMPKEGSKLHYRLIGFSFPVVSGASGYNIEIAKGNYNSEKEFRKNIFETRPGESNKIIAEVPFFGKEYTWRVSYTNKRSKVKKSELHHFATLAVDSNMQRLRVIKQAETYKDAYVFLDANKALYDMKGNLVWFLPGISGISNDNANVRDLKISAEGAITFMLNDKQAYEINYNGDILWRAPDNGNDNPNLHYHHQFTHLSNGNYMILGTEPVTLKINKEHPFDSISIVAGADTIKKDKNTDYKPFPLGSIIEYSPSGNVVWQWKTSQHFDSSGIAYCLPHHGKNKFEVHLNAFFFDEQDSIIYLSFRNTSQVVSIKYPEGTIVNAYGGNDSGLFYGQHSCIHSRAGYLYLFDNNQKMAGNLPKILMLQEPLSKNDTLKKIWEYEYTPDGINEKQQPTTGFTIGGNVIELPDNSLFTSMCNPYSEVLIVSHDKKILWSAIPETWSVINKKWMPFSQYRASIITGRTEMEHLVWSNGKN